MSEWFGHDVVWRGVEASVLLQVFYQLTKGIEQWRRKGAVEEEGSSGGGREQWRRKGAVEEGSE